MPLRHLHEPRKTLLHTALDIELAPVYITLKAEYNMAAS